MGRRSRALVVGLGLALALFPGARAPGSGPEAARLAAVEQAGAAGEAP